jgi:TolA-binding protein
MILQTPPPPPSLPFDPNQLIPLIGVVSGLIITGVVLYAFFKSDIAAAIAERIRAGINRRKHWKKVGGEWIDTAGDESQVPQLEERLEQMHGQIAELAERLDFAERLLAQKRERTLRAGE